MSSGTLGRPRSFVAAVSGFVARVPVRLRERSFWTIQAMVLGITALHVLVEVGGVATSPLSASFGVHHIPVALYIAPIVYASLKYGIEGGLLTGMWSAALAVPNIVLWHRPGFGWLGETAYVAVVVGSGVLLAVPVERERRERYRAEATSRRLALLNEVATTLARAPDLEATLNVVLRRLADVMRLETASLEIWDAPDRTAVPTGSSRPPAPDTSRRSVVIPLVAERPERGALVAVPGDRPLGSDDRELLDAVASEIGVAIENARLHRAERGRLESYVRQVTRAQEEERKRIARELHDDAAQSLVLLCRGLDGLGEPTWGLPGSAGLRLRELRGEAGSILESVRRFSRELRPAMLDDLGLVPALESLTSDLGRRLGLVAGLEVSGVPRRLPPEVEVALFRIAQECLRNVERHAHASRVLVAASFEDPLLSLTVTDDGAGFDPNVDHLAIGGRLGLVGARERAQLVGGSFSVRSRIGEGTTVTVKVRA